MIALKPKGFKLIALTQMVGTGGVTVKGYFNSDTKQVWFLVVDPATEREMPFGPIEMRCLETLATTIRDVMEMGGKPVSYLPDEDHE